MRSVVQIGANGQGGRLAGDFLDRGVSNLSSETIA